MNCSVIPLVPWIVFKKWPNALSIENKEWQNNDPWVLTSVIKCFEMKLYYMCYHIISESWKRIHQEVF
jgi:hypothetical protein